MPENEKAESIEEARGVLEKMHEIVCDNVYTIVAFIAAGTDSHSALRKLVDVPLLPMAQYLLYMDCCKVFYHLCLYEIGARLDIA